MPAPVVLKSIPDQIVNELAAFHPLDLKKYIQVAEGDEPARFMACLASGASLPKGLICTADGILTGIPAKGSLGTHEIIITAENADGSVETEFNFTIKLSLHTGGSDHLDELKKSAWEALANHGVPPDLTELYDRPFSAMELQYILERWGMIKIWDVFNLEPPSEKRILQLEGASPHYAIYDRGSCLVAAPVDLFSHERTLEDGLQTARVMAREAYKRQWTMELVGYYKLTRAAWVELQVLGDHFGRRPEVVNFNPTSQEIRVYSSKTQSI